MFNIKLWSVKKKVLAFAFSLAVGGFSILALTAGILLNTSKVQKQTMNAVEVNRGLAAIQTHFFTMSSALSNYLASSSEEDWKQKLAADEAAATAILELKKLNITDELRPYIEEIERFDDKDLNPMDEKVREYLKEHSAHESLLYYKEHYVPLTGKLQQIIAEAVQQTERDLKDTNGTAQRVSLYGALALSAAIFGGTVFGVLLCWFMASWLGRTLGQAVSSLEKESAKAKLATGQVHGASQGLAKATTEQAAALQETAASIEEMSAMIAKNAENASQSGAVSKESVTVATRGKQAASEMIQAIHDINESNTQIMQAIEESNRKITEITVVIAEIGNKTKVINDIVFQTKLLSFNASVEAARAGEHGKGFAVVAEEVGNLAQMSGNAAKEITQMLDSSIKKVEGIVTETRTKVERLISEGKTKVATGTRVAEGSGKVLDEIMEQVSKVNGMVDEISTATHEQATGVTEITKAMTQLDRVTQENSMISTKIAANATDLAEQTNTLRSVVHQLEDMIWGEGAKNDGPVGGRKPAKAAKTVKAAPASRVEKAAKPVQSVSGSPGNNIRTAVLVEESLPSESDPRFKEI